MCINLYLNIMSIRVYRVSEKTAINFINLLHYSRVFDCEAYSQIRQDHRINSTHIGFGCREEFLDFVSGTMDYNVRKFASMDFEHPGAVCRGRIANTKREECPICLRDVPEWTYIAKMDCGHIFHERCLLQWIRSGCAMSNTCPKCRCEIDSGKILTVTIYDNGSYTWNDICYYDRYRVNF